MQDYNTIIGIITMRSNECSFSVIENRYRVGSGTVQSAYSARTAHPFRRNGAPFRFKLSKAQ